MPQNVHLRCVFAAIAACCALSAGGCATYQGPRIDPTGESLFTWPGELPVSAPPATLAPVPIGAVPVATPVAATAPAFAPLQGVPPMVPSTPFGNVTAPPVYSDPPGMVPVTPLVGPAPGIATTVPTLPPPPVAAPGAAVAPAGALPPPPVPPVLPAAAIAPYGKEYLRVVPEGLVAPVGSEMLVKAGIFSPEGSLITNQRVDWSINPTGVGQFTELGWRDIGQLFGFMEAPQRIDNWNATSTTAVVPITLNTSTPDPNDDIPIYRGEAWVSLTSPVEGTSVVTAIATAYSEFNQATSTIYWVDAQWLFPQPTVVEPGRSHTLTTTVMRRTDGAPLAGWTVRYDVSGGALGYEGGSFVESATDANGRASVEVTPKDAGGGTTSVGITVIRPPTAGPAVMPRLQLGRSVTTVSWAPGVISVPVVPAAPPLPVSAPQSATPPPSLPPTGPPLVSPPPSSPYSAPPPATQAPSPYTPQGAAAGKPRLDAALRTVSTDQVSVGQFASFELTVTNRGDGIARHIVITDRFDRGLRHPSAKPNEYTVVYSQMKDLAPNESQTIPLTFQVVDGGTQCHEATVAADGADPVSQRGCINAKQSALEAKITGPRSRVVGETAEFSASVKNVGDVAATHIEVVIHCDAAITPTMAERGSQPLADNGLLLKIDSLAPGERRTFGMQGQCRAASNRACAKVTVTADGGVNQADEACVEILPPLTSPAPGGAAAPAATSNLRLSVSAMKTPAHVGEKQLINVIIENAGQQSETQVSMRVILPAEFTADPTQIQPPAADIQQNEIRFATIAELTPGQQQRYVIPVTPNRVGQQVRIQADIAATSLPTPKSFYSDAIDIATASP